LEIDWLKNFQVSSRTFLVSLLFVLDNSKGKRTDYFTASRSDRVSGRSKWKIAVAL